MHHTPLPAAALQNNTTTLIPLSTHTVYMPLASAMADDAAAAMAASEAFGR
jgi:hypothetical protein